MTTDVNITNETYFHNEIEISSNITFIINATIYITDIEDKTNHNNDKNINNSLMEPFVIQIDLSHLHAGFDLTLDWKRSYIQNIITINMIRSFLDDIWSDRTLQTNIGPLWTFSSANCVLQSIDRMLVSGLFGVTNFSRIVIQPTRPQSSTPFFPRNSISNRQPLELDIDQLINTVMDLILSEYPVLVTTAISGFIQANNTVQSYINDYLAQRIVVPADSTTDCNIKNRTRSGYLSLLNHENPSRWFNFSNVALLRQFNTYLNQPRTISKINNYIDCSIETIKSMVRDVYIVPNANETEARNDSAMVRKSTLRLIDLDIQHFGQFERIQFMSPTVDGLSLQNSFLWNHTGISESYLSSKEALPTLFLAWEVDYVPLDISVLMNVTILLNDVEWVVDAIIHLDREEFLQLTLMELFSHSQCWLASINGTSFDLFGGDRLFQFLEVVFDTAIVMHSSNDTLNIIVNTSDFSDAPTIISSFFIWSVDVTRDITASVLRTFITDSRMMCYAERSSSNDNHTNYMKYPLKPMFLILVAVFMFLQPLVLLMKRSSESLEVTQHQQNSYNELIEPLLQHEGNIVQVANEPNGNDDDDDDSSDGSEPQSFMKDRNIPLFVQYGIPIAIILTIILLLSSNLSVGATVDVVIANIYESRSIQIPSLFTFSLYNTARDMWTAQIYPLFFLVLIFSGIWPYMKLFFMLYVWMGPMMSPTFRGRLLLKLDALSKFSLVDTYVLIVMMVAFQYQLPLLEDSSLSVYVVPKFGFFGFLAATSASLLLGHVLVYYHRHVEIMSIQLPPGLVGNELISDPNAVSYKAKEALRYHAYHFADGTKRRLTKGTQYLLLTWLMLVFVLFTVGIAQKCFVFEFGGLAGALLSEGQNRISYSVVSFAAAIPTSTEHSRWMSTVLLQFVFIFYTIIMPLAAGIFLTVVWVVPLSWTAQYSLLVMAEIANAWSALEVFCLSIVVALLEIETFASFMVGHKCDWIDQLLMSHHTTIGIDTCYSVTASVSWNVIFLVMGAILHSLLISLVLRFVQFSVHERLLESQGELTDVVPEMRRSFLHRLALSRWGGLVLAPVTNDNIDEMNPTVDVTTLSSLQQLEVEATLPAFSDEILTTPWEGMNESEWKDSIEHDAAWKEWKEATNVT